MKTPEIKTRITEMLGIDYPIIMAPMFLVTNTKMMIAALNKGITAAIPALNFRTDEALRKAITDVKSNTDKPMGVNLIVNKSNPYYLKQLKTCVELGVSYIITSLGNPKQVIDECKKHGIKVFCDVVDLQYAKKVEDLGADAVIAVNKNAGGHSGNMTMEDLVPLLVNNLSIPVISAGGIATGKQLKSALDIGAEGVSIGTLFIASNEAGVSEDYKKALIEYGASDIIMTRNISGTPLTVINTPYMKKVGNKQSRLSRFLNTNKKLRKYLKMFIMIKGMRSIKNAANKPTYKTVWVAGPSIEHIKKIQPVELIIDKLIEDLLSTYKQ